MYTIFGLKIYVHPKMVVYFLRSLGKFLITWDKFADENTVQSRRIVCGPCVYRDQMQCTECGCFVKLKTLFTFEQCPKGKW
jgi:hypothetical protein